MCHLSKELKFDTFDSFGVVVFVDTVQTIVSMCVRNQKLKYVLHHNSHFKALFLKILIVLSTDSKSTFYTLNENLCPFLLVCGLFVCLFV